MSRPFCGCAGSDWEGYPICDGRCEIKEENLGASIAERFGLDPLQGEAICKTALRAHQIAAEHLGARPALKQKVLGEVSEETEHLGASWVLPRGEPEGCWGCPERARLDALVAAGADTLRAESERLREAEAEINRLRFANAALEDANVKLKVGLTQVCQDKDDQNDRLQVRITRLQTDLARARWSLDDLRRRAEWDDLEGDP